MVTLRTNGAACEELFRPSELLRGRVTHREYDDSQPEQIIDLRQRV
jgi:hypothetical protein